MAPLVLVLRDPDTHGSRCQTSKLPRAAEPCCPGGVSVQSGPRFPTRPPPWCFPKGALIPAYLFPPSLSPRPWALIISRWSKATGHVNNPQGNAGGFEMTAASANNAGLFFLIRICRVISRPPPCSPGRVLWPSGTYLPTRVAQKVKGKKVGAPGTP